MSTAIRTSLTPYFRGTELAWTSEEQLSQAGASCPCCGLSLELVAEFAAFQTCAVAIAPQVERVLVAV